MRERADGDRREGEAREPFREVGLSRRVQGTKRTGEDLQPAEQQSEQVYPIRHPPPHRADDEQLPVRRKGRKVLTEVGGTDEIENQVDSPSPRLLGYPRREGALPVVPPRPRSEFPAPGDLRRRPRRYHGG